MAKEGYLCVTQRLYDRLSIGPEVEIVVVSIRDGQVTLAIKADKDKFHVRRRSREEEPWRDDPETKG